VATDVLVVLSTLGVITTTSIVIVPAALDAATAADGAPSPAPARDDEHQKTLDLLAALVSRSRAVLDVRPRGDTPFVELLLWIADAHDPGRINTDELGLVRHSDVSQVLTFTGREPAGEPAPAVGRAELVDDDFRRAWRTAAGSRSRIIARRISDLRIVPWPVPNHPQRLEIELTWASGSADPPDKATAVVDMPSAASQE
jgi:hypothetical protein